MWSTIAWDFGIHISPIQVSQAGEISNVRSSANLILAGGQKKKKEKKRKRKRKKKKKKKKEEGKRKGMCVLIYGSKTGNKVQKEAVA